MYYPTGFEHSVLGVSGTSCICDECANNNCRNCKPHSECGYDSFKISIKEDEYWDKVFENLPPKN